MLRLSLMLIALAVLSGCTPPAEVVRPDELQSFVPGATVLVLVYSRTGHTARMARGLASALGADYVRIVGRGNEGNNFFSTPSWTTDLPTTPPSVDLHAYHLVLIGGPIWYWRPNALTNSFLRHADLTGKDVVLFYTFEGGRMSAATEANWRRWVTERGGTVRDVVGINRRELPAGSDLATEAARIARERSTRWGAAPGGS